MSFNSEAMKDLGEIYKAAFLHTFRNAVPEHQEYIRIFWANFVAGQKAYTLLTEAGTANISRLIFQDAKISDFLMSFTSNFFIFWAASDDEQNATLEVVARGLTLRCFTTVISHEYDAMPKNISERLPIRKDSVEVLRNNPWLFVLVLSLFFMTYLDFANEEKRPKTKVVN